MDKDKVHKVGLLIMGFASGFVIASKLSRGAGASELLFPFLILVAGILLAFATPKK